MKLPLRYFVGGVGVGLAVLAWIIPAALTGGKEVWDFESGALYLSAASFLIAAVIAFITRHTFLGPICVYLGLVLGLMLHTFLFPGDGANLIVLGALVMIQYVLVAVLGALVGVGLRGGGEPKGRNH